MSDQSNVLPEQGIPEEVVKLQERIKAELESLFLPKTEKLKELQEAMEKRIAEEYRQAARSIETPARMIVISFTVPKRGIVSGFFSKRVA